MQWTIPGPVKMIKFATKIATKHPPQLLKNRPKIGQIFHPVGNS